MLDSYFCEGMPGRVSSTSMAGVVAGGDGTGTCTAGFVAQRIIASFFPFLFLLELASAHFLSLQVQFQ